MPMLVRLLMGMMLLAASPAFAQAPDIRAPDDAVAHAYAQGIAGPATVPLRDLAILTVPKDFVFVPGAAGRRLMHGIINTTDESILGVVVPAGHYGGWVMAVSVLKTGHVLTSQVDALDPAEIRGQIATTIRAGNPARMLQGAGPIDAGDFLTPPRYERNQSRYTTAIRIFESGPSTGDDDLAAINTYHFGRAQTLQVSLIAGLSDYQRHLPAYQSIVAGLSFKPGQSAVDFTAGRDAIASHLIEVIFGGRTHDEIASDAAAAAAEAKRIAALPPPVSYSKELKLVLFALLGLIAVVVAALSMRGRATDAEQAPSPRAGGIDRVLRAPAKA